MKTKLVWLIIALIAIATIFSIVSNNSVNNSVFKPLEMNVGDEFTYINYANTMYVLNYIMEDVTGDGTKDMVIMLGEKASIDSLNASNIDLVIYEPNGEKFYNLNLKKFDGEMPRIAVCELTGDGILDVILTVTLEDGSTQIRIVSMQGPDFKEIFKAKDNKGVVLTGNFLDGFKVYLKCSKYNKEANMDLADRKENYVTNGFFDESGRLLKTDCKVTTSGFFNVEFVQLDGYFGLQTTQRVLGFDSDDLLDEITSIWKYEDGKWNLKESKAINVGNLLY